MIAEWFNALDRLIDAFQAVGTLSVLAWLFALAGAAVLAASVARTCITCAAVVLCGVGLLLATVLAGPLVLAVWAATAIGLWAARRRVSRTALCVGAVAAALVGVALAGINSDAVSALRVDRTQELLEARRRQEALRAEKVRRAKSGTADIRFAEDSEADRMDLAGKTAEEAALLTGTAGGAAGTPAYKQRGPRRRDPANRPGERCRPGTWSGPIAWIASTASPPASPCWWRCWPC